MSTITITVLGGGEEIGANSYLVCADGHRVLIDCGLHPKKEGKEALPRFELLRGAPDAVLVSHGHVDHCGALPYLLKQFPQAIPYATAPTIQVVDRMLHNSVSVMEAMSLEQGIADYPLYTHEDVDFALRRAYGMGLSEAFAVVPREDSALRASFHHSGHVLGGASIGIEVPGHTLFYTGDVCMTDQELLAGFALPDDGVRVDTLVIESTYGANGEADEILLEEEIDRFAGEARAVLGRGGAILVPAFALGRTQEVLNIISRLQDDGRLPAVPVYASGLGRAIYEIYGRNAAYLRPGARLTPLEEFGRIGDVWSRRVVRELLGEPSLIVATSGMMVENTPSALIAQEMVQGRKHAIFFVGYLDPDTLGHRVRHAKPGDKVVFELGGREVKVVLETIRRFHFGAHAPRKDLQGLVARLKPKNVVFVHGDPEAVAWMQAHAREGARGFAPKTGETVTLEG